MVLPRIARDRPIEAWIIDDAGIPKKGQYSIGVSDQYCAELGKQANCEVAVYISIRQPGSRPQHRREDPDPGAESGAIGLTYDAWLTRTSHAQLSAVRQTMPEPVIFVGR
jgi:hypothetical protein